MRLLRSQCDNEGYFSLTEFDRHELPKYAILSHTWIADNQEVTFEDIQHRSGQEKEGYGKLRFCAERARTAGLDYFWVDSCCIKKSDSAELTESLNSMFGWYARAEVCYAYLSDVSTLKHGRDDDINRPWMAQFEQSRWHRRGWTLQELLAPRKVEFWSRDDVKLGDKNSLGHEIHHITGIPTSALRQNGQKELQSFSIAERHAWMKGRVTKLEEDQAYCLLGIFGVSIRILYGEGNKNALSHLNDEIALDLRNPLRNVQNQSDDLLGSHQFNSSRDATKSADGRRATLLESLRNETLNARRLGVASAQSGTCRWLLTHPIYKRWEDSSGTNDDGGFLWIKGKPGAGKSTLMKYIYEETERSTTPPDMLISFFFNARGAQSEKTIHGMWRALVYQLLMAAPELQTALDALPFASTLDPMAPAWDVKILSSIFEDVVLHLGRRKLTCFIDALDECDEQEIRVMVNRLEELQDRLAE